jgi:hypothetical protein
MTRSQRFAVTFLFALFPCVLGSKGCYFGNDEVPLGSNAPDHSNGRDGSAGTEGEDHGNGNGATGAAGGEGGASGVPGKPGPDEPVFVFQSAPRFAAPSATGGTPGP